MDFLNLLFRNSHDHLSFLFLSSCAADITYRILCEAFHLQMECFHSSPIDVLNADVFLKLGFFSYQSSRMQDKRTKVYSG